MARDPYRHPERWFSSWPVFVLGGVFLLLCGQWPKPLPPAGTGPVPAPFDVEYVVLAPGSSLSRLRSDVFAHRSGFGSPGSFAALDIDDLSAFLPAVPLPGAVAEIESAGAAALWDSAASVPPQAPPDAGVLASLPLSPAPPAPAPGPQDVPRGPKPGDFWSAASPRLQSAGFHFESPGPMATSGVASVRFYVETDDSGRVAHVLLDSAEPPSPPVRAILAAVERGAASTNASGFLDAGWIP